MTKADIIEIVAAQIKRKGNPIKKSHIKVMVECVFDVFIEKLAKEGRIEIRGFGVFKVKRTPARIGRNPLTKEEAEVPARNIVQFKAGKRMKEVVSRTKE